MFRKNLCFILVLHIACANVNNYYCGDRDCYDVLEVTRETPKADIKRAFRFLAAKTHPDKFLDPDDKEKAEERFRVLSTAYDILRDDEARADYDYMLDHPDEFYMNYYRAWRRRVAPNVDVRIVIAVTISLISLVQYYNGWTKYDTAIKHFASLPKYRLQAVELAKKEGLFCTEKKVLKQMTKEQIRQEEEKVIRKVIEDKMDIRGVYAKPTYKDILWIQLVFLPYWIFNYMMWWCTWIWKFWILKQEFGVEEKLHIIRKYFAMSTGQFDALDEEVKLSYLKDELWIKEKFLAWKSKKDEEMKIKLAQSGRYKSYRRYMKNYGPGRMYFDDS